MFHRLIPFLISTKHGVPKTTLALALCFNRIVCVFFPSDFSKPIFSLGREGDGKGSDSTVINLDRSPSSGCRTLFLIFRHRVSPFARARPAAWYVPCLPIVGVRSLSLAHGSVGRPAATRLVLPRHCSRPQHSLMPTLVLPQPSLFLLVYLMIPILSCQYLFSFIIVDYSLRYLVTAPFFIFKKFKYLSRIPAPREAALTSCESDFKFKFFPSPSLKTLLCLYLFIFCLHFLLFR